MAGPQATRGGRGRPARTLLLAAIAVLVASCFSPSPSQDQTDLQRLLADDRRAHLEGDASLIAAHVADTLISVDAGVVSRMSRAEVERSFQESFAGTRYEAWDDVHAPIVHLVPGGAAWVVRTVRVERTRPGLGGRSERRTFTCAWTATYERRQHGWRMTSVTSTFVPESTDADRILAAALRHWGGGAASLATLRTVARARGPRGTFQVDVCSARDGRARIDFDSGFSAGITAHTAWMIEAPGTAAQPLSSEAETFLRGHEVHMNLLAPASRYRSLQFTGTTTFAGRPALALTGFDAAGEPAHFFYAAADSAPLGYRVADHVRHGEPPTITIGDWDGAGHVRVFRRATFHQGTEEFTYRFTSIDIDPAAADSLLADPR